MTIHLYAFDTPNGRKISIALEEMALPYQVHIVDITKGEQYAADFLAISPNNKIPAIIDDDGPGGKSLSIFESGAILVYLGEKSGLFWPTALDQRMHVLQWLMFQVGGFGPIPGQVHHFIGLPEGVDRAYGLQRFQKETKRLYTVMEHHLVDSVYFAGENVSIADFAIYGWAWRHERHGVDLQDYPSVKDWYERMSRRPGVMRGMQVPLR